MAVEFVLEINVQTSTRRGYRDFIQNLRVRLGVRSSHNRPTLVVQQDRPTRFFDLIICTNDHAVTFRFRMDNLYLIGYRIESGQWLEFNNEIDQHLILEQGTTFLGFTGSYSNMVRFGDQGLEETRVGFYNLGYAINQLATSTDRAVRARGLIVVIMMFCESTRLIPVSDYSATNFDNSYGTSSVDYNATNRNREGVIHGWIVDLVRNWETLSAALLRADAYPEVSFRLPPNVVRLPPDQREIRSIADAAAILGVLLGLCFRHSGPRRFPRLALDDEGQCLALDDKGQCFEGVPFLEVFSVRINDINGENPGQLFGTITINNGLDTQYIYNRTRDNYQSIKPGQNALLTGPARSVSAFGSFTIQLLLTDKDTWFWDDEVTHKEISWDASNISNVYDKLLFPKLDGSRGSVTVNYAVLRNAVAARVTITVEEGGERTVNVYGQVYAHYDNWEDPNTRCLLFGRTSHDYVDVRQWQTIPLLRSMIAVPLGRSLKVTALLYDHDTLFADDLIANGTVEFSAEMFGPTSFKKILGEDGNWVAVTVYWTSEI